MKITFSWDDGAPEDQKLFELHYKYEIPGMFFVPTKNREGLNVLTPETIKSAESRYVSFGGHTQNHTYLTEIPLKDVEQEIKENKEYLENILGHQITDFCLPGGQYSKEVLEIVYKHFSTIRTADTMNFKYCGGPFKPAIHFYPRSIKSLVGNSLRNFSYRELLYLLCNYNNNYFEMVKCLIQFESNRHNSVVMIWGHSWEIEKYGLWNELEELMGLAKLFGCCEYSDMFIYN